MIQLVVITELLVLKHFFPLIKHIHYSYNYNFIVIDIIFNIILIIMTSTTKLKVLIYNRMVSVADSTNKNITSSVYDIHYYEIN